MPKFQFPDPDDRSINNPSTIADSERVLNLYNQENDDDRERVTETVKTWFVEQALDHGWSDAEFHGNGCVLSVELSKESKD
ncbi:hypothetical protein IMY97_08045 [Pectobacterium versatile]|uniref:hypothetical protein n=1 Tax=Pectobacterium versatile TaxID=2488639 RepID=UPI00166099CB|nr:MULTISPECIES: hypothetical protein [Pectobacterium]MBD0845700.1 hypothetical protein [Pectobacterium carotovorum subsp. carotovorum]MBK4826954.1 hypothetical protein [Pectobacterium carotovorum subsp. carotovorum]QUI37251.1 hypothetical protein IMY97_08045 [Pectobacterium versatile]